ncbi:hypothetical protein FJ950_01175 [Mesorhizobium sp. B2-3-14]|uniref:hypothetical protein n=1 Tax=Mesorhizobium sp. B2-3-14 TaxID=2589950 RepID=UPI00112795AD|nr:hypothetical protein [Mesorhizobium sp. B2-3-14]TPL88997.1 hypothetical protein FJ950_01175 [Mesorhizobium sp. B2-3-14]
MGEAKRRETFSQRIRREQPFCIFCGGATPSETVEHYPPRSIFDGKHRPQGMEFGACRECNEASREADLVAATLSRMMPNPKTSAGRAEVKRLLHSAFRISGFKDEFLPERNQVAALNRLQGIASQLPSWNFLRIGGPIVARSMTIFGSKLGLALHTATTGRILLTSGAVAIQWYSNLQAYQDALPKEFLAMCGPGRTLRQGNFEVGEQFSVASVVPDEDGSMSAHFATFRQSFAVLMFATEKAEEAHRGWSVSPGFLKRPLTVIPVQLTPS